MDDLSNIFEECERYLRTALARWRKQLPDLYEDAFQEGMIQCWRDIEAGEDIKLKILRRASMAANKFMHRNGEYYFGKPRKSRDGIHKNQKDIEKVKVYLEETKGIRDGAMPKATEVSGALGLPYPAARKIMKDIKEGRIDHMVYREDGRMDWNHYKTMSVETLAIVNGADQEIRAWTDDLRMPTVEWEDEAASNLDMEAILKQLSERHRTVLYMYFYEGHSAISIGEHFGHTTNISTKGHRHIQNAVSQAKMILNPYEGACEAGHGRTPETAKVKQRSDGVWYRQCRVCQSASGSTTVAKQKATGFKTGRKEREYCPKNHKKDIRDSRGALRCSKCRAEAQKAYTKRRAEKLRLHNEGA